MTRRHAFHPNLVHSRLSYYLGTVMPCSPRFLVLVYLSVIAFTAISQWKNASACTAGKNLEKCANDIIYNCCIEKGFPSGLQHVCHYGYLRRMFMGPDRPTYWFPIPSPPDLPTTFELFEPLMHNRQRWLKTFVECFNRGIDHTDCCISQWPYVRP